jgi:hypothetical protein
MSRQEDREFCKIAIQTGSVSEDDAKRCLSYANKVESAGQPRPRVGTVFVKAKLLGQQDVRRIYEALQKRQGQAVGGGGAAVARADPHRRQRSADRKSPQRELRRSSSGQKRVSQTAMVFSVISLVALVIMVGVMGALFYASSSNKEPVTPKTASTPMEPETEGSIEKEAKVAAANAVNPEMLNRLKQELRQAIHDARSFVRDDRYGLALSRLKAFDSQNSTYLSREPFLELRRSLTQEIGEIEEKIGKEFEDSLAAAREHFANGEPDRGVSVLQRFRDQVDGETQTKVDAELEKLQTN